MGAIVTVTATGIVIGAWFASLTVMVAVPALTGVTVNDVPLAGETVTTFALLDCALNAPL